MLRVPDGSGPIHGVDQPRKAALRSIHPDESRNIGDKPAGDSLVDPKLMGIGKSPRGRLIPERHRTDTSRGRHIRNWH